MALETATFISQLVSSNPPGSDLKSQGDDHLRLIKSVLQNCFPDASKALYFPKGIQKTANYTVLEADDNTLFSGDPNSASFTFTLPVMTGLDAGWKVGFFNERSGANTVTIAPASGTIDGQANIVLRFRDFALIWLVGSSWHSMVLRRPRSTTSPASFTSNQNDFDIGDNDDFLITADAARDVTGIAKGFDGRVVRFFNKSAFTITFKDNSGSSIAANRIQLISDLALAPDTGAAFFYDAISALWRLLSPQVDASTIGVGKQTAVFPAGSIIPRANNGAFLSVSESTTNFVTTQTLDFDPTTQQFAQFSFTMPKSWNEGTITYKVKWRHPATTVNFNVVWQLQGLALGDGDTIDTAFGTAITVSDTGGSELLEYTTAESTAVTISNTPAEGDRIVFQIARVPADVGDTLAVDAQLVEVILFFTTNANTDN